VLARLLSQFGEAWRAPLCPVVLRCRAVSCDLLFLCACHACITLLTPCLASSQVLLVRRDRGRRVPLHRRAHDSHRRRRQGHHGDLCGAGARSAFAARADQGERTLLLPSLCFFAAPLTLSSCVLSSCCSCRVCCPCLLCLRRCRARSAFQWCRREAASAGPCSPGKRTTDRWIVRCEVCFAELLKENEIRSFGLYDLSWRSLQI
jgi:hypothetical protein